MIADIAIVDYGMGNLRSVAKALEHVAPQQRVVVSSDPATLLSAGRIVFPGVGAMGDCMRELAIRGLTDVVRETARSKPFLGICLGMQMLFEHSEEGDVAGLGVLPGRVRRFFGDLGPQVPEHLKVPHMGWNTVRQTCAHPLWQGVTDNTRFYFVHSYYVEPEDKSQCCAVTPYPFDFTAAVAVQNLFAVQFHPEKSQQAGLQLLANFAQWDGKIRA
jgi:glutamine amidotransferase